MKRITRKTYSHLCGCEDTIMVTVIDHGYGESKEEWLSTSPCKEEKCRYGEDTRVLLHKLEEYFR